MNDPQPPSGTVAERMAALAVDLSRAGALDRGWRQAFFAVPRHLFVPDRVWFERDDGRYGVFDRSDFPDDWWDGVYGDVYIVTQVDDGTPPDLDAVGEYSTSSASQPSYVFRMLSELRVMPGMRVLEIGTGSGYTAALLSARLGAEHVTTVEVDKQVAAAAVRALTSAGFSPTVVVADGAHGHPPNAPYDRVIATCLVRTVPYPWVAQTRPGGLLLTPFGTAYHRSGLVLLEVDDTGTAHGRFIGDAAFMWLRDQRTPTGRIRDFIHHDHDHDADTTTTTLDPAEVHGDQHAEFAIGLRVPDCQHIHADAADDSGEYTLWLFDAQGSWASVDYEPGVSTHPVEQYGPRRLWDEIENAHQWWDSAGRPERERFGLTITPGGQTVWLDNPGSDHSWPVP